MITIRASSTSNYLDCQARAAISMFGDLFAEHGFKLRRPNVSIGALIGSGVHGAAEVGLKESMAGRGLVAASTIEDAGIDAFRARRAEEEAEAEATIMDPVSCSIDDAETQVRKMSRQYRLDVVAKAHPIAVENRIKVELRPGVIVSGQGDLLALDMVGGEVATIRDAKTSRHKTSALKHLTQLGTYGLLYRSEGLEPQAGQIDLIPRVAVTKPQPPIEEQPINLLAAERMAWSTINDFADKGEAFAKDGNPSRFLLNPSSNLCSPKYCRAYGTPACAATYNGD